MSYYGWKPYVPVAARRAQAAKLASKPTKDGRKLEPVVISGTKIATTFWGKAWCDNLERYSDYSNRLPRGRTYVRNGSVIDLQITSKTITALVSGSDVYKVKIEIDSLHPTTWTALQADCARSIDSLLDLLQGKFSKGVMERLSRQGDGLFPAPKQIKMSCSCPDWAGVCKHVAAVFYGVGSRLDSQPELLFTLRAVDHLELIDQAVSGGNLDRALGNDQSSGLGDEDLSALFGIDLDQGSAAPPVATAKKVAATKKAVVKKAAVKKAATKKVTVKKTAVKKTAVKKASKSAPASAAVTKKKVATQVASPAVAAAKPKTPRKKAAAKTASKASPQNK